MDATRTGLRIENDDVIAGLGRGLAVIECFDDDHARLTSAEVAERTMISRAAARRYLLSLCHFGYARTNGKVFWLAPRVLRLGQSYLLSARLPRLAQPFLEQMFGATQATAGLGVLDGHDVIYLARCSGTTQAKAGVSLGARLPAHVVSAGRAILTTFNDDELDAWLAAHHFACFTACGEQDRSRFRAGIVHMRALGYAIADQQFELGWRGVAVPLRDRHGHCAGALSLTTPVERGSVDETIAAGLPHLRLAEAKLRALL